MTWTRFDVLRNAELNTDIFAMTATVLFEIYETTMENSYLEYIQSVVLNHGTNPL